LTTDVLALIIEARWRGRVRPAFFDSGSTNTNNMSSTTTDHIFSRPLRSKSETKADMTDHHARAIIEAEAALREAKTARLRKARMENEAKPAVTQPAEQRRAKRAAPRRAPPSK
jgi:hypothetical protein